MSIARVNRLSPYMFMAPAMVIMAIALLYPLGYMVFWHAADLYQPDNHKGNPTDRYAGQGVNSNVLALPIEKCDRLGGLNDPYLVPTGSPSEFWPPGSFPEKIRPRIEAWRRL